MKAISIVVATMILSGCAATQAVTDKVVSAQVAYCGLDTAARLAVRRQYEAALARRADGGVGYNVDIDCPGDRYDS